MTAEPRMLAAPESSAAEDENAELRRRCSMLASELRVSNALFETLLQQRELDPALDDALAMCLDACEQHSGALYLLSADGGWKVRALGASPSRWTREQLRGFFGYEAQLRAIIESGATTYIPGASAVAANQQPLLAAVGSTQPLLAAAGSAQPLLAAVGSAQPLLATAGSAQPLLAAAGVAALLVVPIRQGQQSFGALLLAGPERAELLAFGESIAARLGQVLALAARFVEERHARDRAEQQAALYNALLVHAPDCVAQLDPRGVILFVNNVMRALQPDMTVGRDWLATQRAEHRELVQRAFDAVISTGESMSYETAALGPDATLRWYGNRLGPVLRNGEIIGATLVARDVTEKKQAEEQLVVADRMASFGMLAASVAHEINNPLAAMMINLELIGRDLASQTGTAENERLRKELEGAREGGKRVTQVVRDLKIFSRSNETLTRVKLRSVLESTLRMAGNEIRHRARLETDFADVPTVDGDETRLGQVFLNLIVNAAQAIPEGDPERNVLRVSTRVDEQERVVVSVADTGCGIPERDRAQIFRPFFTTKAPGVGTGLGLSICERIIKSMGGSIGFESTVGQGTTFWVALPPSTRAAAPSWRPLADATRAGRRGRVLIVEDDRMVADVIRRFINREHDVRMVGHAQEALQLVTREPCFDVILCDLMMPQMTGQELFEALREVQPEQAERMVFMTGGPFTPGARRFLGSVRNHRIEKPFDLQALRRLLNELVR